MSTFERQFWTGSALLDEHVSRAVHELGSGPLDEITKRAGELLVAGGRINPDFQFLPDTGWVEESLERLEEKGEVVCLNPKQNIFAAVKKGRAG